MNRSNAWTLFEKRVLIVIKLDVYNFFFHANIRYCMVVSKRSYYKLFLFLAIACKLSNRFHLIVSNISKNHFHSCTILMKCLSVVCNVNGKPTVPHMSRTTKYTSVNLTQQNKTLKYPSPKQTTLNYKITNGAQ